MPPLYIHFFLESNLFPRLVHAALSNHSEGCLRSKAMRSYSNGSTNRRIGTRSLMNFRKIGEPTWGKYEVCLSGSSGGQRLPFVAMPSVVDRACSLVQIRILHNPFPYPPQLSLSPSNNLSAYKFARDVYQSPALPSCVTLSTPHARGICVTTALCLVSFIPQLNPLPSTLVSNSVVLKQPYTGNVCWTCVQRRCFGPK